MAIIDWVERGWVPDALIRMGIRQRLRRKQLTEQLGDVELQSVRIQRLMDELASSPIAVETDKANEQHYEVDADFFEVVLGKRLKYSSGYWPSGVESLDQSEEAMLRATCEYAELRDGQAILELGCGWGSLSLWMAERYPNSQITAVSNSSSQKQSIDKKAEQLGLANLTVITSDVNDLVLEQQFDRVVSVEMFEHVRNYRQLMRQIGHWLKPQGKLFVHIFCHRILAYPFEVQTSDDWMAKYFFTGGLMPAADTLLHFQDDLRLESRRLFSGEHYAKTLRAWLNKMDGHPKLVDPILQRVYGDDWRVWKQRWRLFFMACEELFAFDGGQAWPVAHYRFVKR
jgi:cyclopropane-fatty-acyl-phospholipid synthase